MLTRAQRNAKAVVAEPKFILTSAEKQFQWLMGLWAITFAAGAAAALTPPSWALAFAARLPWLANHLPELAQLYNNPVLAVATAAGELQLAIIAWFIACGVRRNNALAWLIVVGKIVFITGFSLFLLTNGWPPLIRSLLISALVFDVIQLVSTVVLWRRAVHSRPSASAVQLTTAERQFRILLWIWAASFALGVVAALVPPFTLPALLSIDPTGVLQANLLELRWFHANPIMLVAAGATEAELTAVCIAVALGIRERAYWVDVLLAGKMLFIVGFAAALLSGPQTPLVHQMLAGGLVIDVIQFSTVLWLRRRAIASTLQTQFFSARQFQTLASLAEISLPTNLAISPRDAVANIDRYLASFESPRRFEAHLTAIGLEYIPLVSLLPKVPLSRMGREECRRFIQRRFYRSRGLARDMIRGAKQLVYLGFYSDERTFSMTKFVPYPDRPPRHATVAAGQSTGATS